MTNLFGESHARLVAAMRLLCGVIEGKSDAALGVKAARGLLDQSEEWMAASDEKVRGIIDGAGGRMGVVTAEDQQDANRTTP